ncbi:hypothetical protein MMC22_003594 [Lobaria immixta]|nr:hypothetical protein [Lobaria immixta]
MEAIAVVSFVSAIAGLIDFSSKVVKRLDDFQSSTHDIPQSLQHVKTILPTTINGLERIKIGARAGTVDSEAQKALLPAIEGCGNRVRRLEEILAEVLPVKDDSSWDKVKKALRSLSTDKEVQDLLKELDRYLANFTFHTTSSVITVGTLPIPVQQAIMIPKKRDPNFVDRTNILREVESNLRDYGRAAIAGIGGVGKTQIAIEYCYRFLNDCPKANIFWAHTDTLHLLHQWLKDDLNGNWLFVLDNVDDINILEERMPSQFFPAGINQLLPQRAPGAILVTTRDKRVGERLAIRGKTTTVPAMNTAEGSQLFSSYLPAALSTSDLSIEQLVDALEHLPLAITQAAAYITENNISVGEYLSILQEKGAEVLDLLNESLSDDRRSNPESNSVIKTWKLSFDCITKQDPRAAEILSLMAMFDLQGIPATFLRHDDESRLVFMRSISTLHSFSLVAKATDGETYSMHRIVQLSVQAWLELQNTTFRWRKEALFTLAKLFPSGDYETWRACEALLPHTRIVLSHELQSSDCATKRAELLQKLAWFDRSQVVIKGLRPKPKKLGKLSRLFKETMRRCLTLHEQVLGSSHPGTLRSMDCLAWAWYLQERYDEAESLARETLTGREQTLGSNHPDTLESMNSLGIILGIKGSFDEAEILCKASFVLRLQLWSPDHPDVLASQVNLADLLCDRGNYEDAEQQFRLLFESLRRVSGNWHQNTLHTMHQWPCCIDHKGRQDEAIDLYRLTLSFEETSLGREHLNTIITRANLALALEKIRNYEEAAEHFRIIVALKADYTESSHPRLYKIIVDAEENLGLIERRLSRVEAEYGDDDYPTYYSN